MRKVELTLKEEKKYEVIKKLVETNGNKQRAKVKLGLKSTRQINRLIAGYKEFGKEFFVHGNRGRKPKHTLTDEFKDEIETLYTSKSKSKFSSIAILYKSSSVTIMKTSKVINE